MEASSTISPLESLVDVGKKGLRDQETLIQGGLII